MAGELIGHGALGLKDALLSFDAFAEQTASSKQAYLELQGGKWLAGFVAYSGATYYRGIREEWDGVVLDVVGVVTDTETLTRVESLALCQATEGTYYYGADALLGAVQTWDDGVTAWDISVTRWDTFTSVGTNPGGALYVHLTDDADASAEQVVVLFGFYFGTRGSVEPQLGPEKLLDPGLEEWMSATIPTRYTLVNVGVGGVAVDRENTTKEEGSYALRLRPAAAGLAALASGGFYQGTLVGVAGAHYVLSGRYYTQWAASDTTLQARIGLSCDGGLTFLGSDGLTTQAAKVALHPTAGAWRRFMFVGRALSDSSDMRGYFDVYAPAGAVLPTGHAVYFDDLHAFRVNSYAYYEPRLSPDGIPQLQKAANDLWFGSETAGLGSVSVLNRDDTRDDPEPYLETMLGRYEFCSRGALLRYGGTLPSGQEIPFENAEPGWAGVIKQFEVNASLASFEVESIRGMLATELPLAVYNRSTFADLAPIDEGRPRPLVLGTLTNARPARIERDATSGFGIYEFMDSDYIAGPLTVPAAVYAYEDADAAATQDAARRVLLTDGVDYLATAGSYYATTARIQMGTNPGPVRIVAGENDAIDFDIGAGALEAFLYPPGIYSWIALLSLLAARMTAVAGVTIEASYYTSTNKVLISKPVGTLNLRLDTGANKARSIYPTLGFAQQTDRTGALLYDGDTVIPHDPDAQHIRGNITGYRDDASGTYTGTPSALIQKAPDVAQFILRRVLRFPASSLNLVRFADGRAASPQLLGVYIGGLASIQGGAGSTLTVQEVLDRLSVSGYADISVDHAGRWDYAPRLDDTPDYAASVATVLSNADFLSFSSSRSLADVYHVCRVNYAQDPSTGIVNAREQTNAVVPALYARWTAKTWDTYLLSDADAATLVEKLGRLARQAVNRYRFTVKGKLLRSKIGDIVDVSARLRKLEEQVGQFEPYLIRLTELTVNPLSHVAEAAGFTQYTGLPF